MNEQYHVVAFLPYPFETLVQEEKYTDYLTNFGHSKSTLLGFTSDDIRTFNDDLAERVAIEESGCECCIGYPTYSDQRELMGLIGQDLYDALLNEDLDVVLLV